MTQIELMSKPKFERFFLRIGMFFSSLPLKLSLFFRNFPFFLKKVGSKLIKPFEVLNDAFINGDWKTRLSFLFCGFGQIFNKQVVYGIINFLFEVCFIVYMCLVGVPWISKFGTLGIPTDEIGNACDVYINDITGTEFYDCHGNTNDSRFIILYSLITIFFMICMLYVWYSSIRKAKLLQDYNVIGKKETDKDVTKTFVSRNYDKTLLAVPLTGVIVFTVLPLVFMILIAFTNYSSEFNGSKLVFNWVGLQNFANMAGLGAGYETFLPTMLKILVWTLIWAFFATFTNYFLGMIVALLINQKAVKLKKLWRTVLITTIAVPQFVSLLLINKMIQDNGIINNLLQQWGIISSPIRFLSDAMIARVMVIVVNMWVGIPYTMLICTGILLNIPEDLYESARIDGASPLKMYMKITLPYMLFVTTPYLISQFVGNINNFNVIYLLTQGGPLTQTYAAGAGQTDLLITWLYKLTMTNASKDYAMSSVIGIIVFCVVAFISLIFYSKSKSVKNEEEFQ